MVRRNVCIDNALPVDAMRIEVSAGNFNETINMSREDFKTLFGFEPKEGLFLEIDIEDVTELRRARIRAIHARMGLRR